MGTRSRGTMPPPIGSLTGHSDLEVPHLVEVGNQTRPRGMPSQLLLRLHARGRHIEIGKHGEPSEMLAGLLFGLRDHRHFQTSSDGFGDLPGGDSFFADSVIPGARFPA